MIRPVVRIALVVLGLVAVIYATASLTGGWLGTPPWWERTFTAWDIAPPHLLEEVILEVEEREPRPGREWISGGVAAAGVALAAFGAWPRRRPMATSSLPTDRV